MSQVKNNIGWEKYFSKLQQKMLNILNLLVL